jgi:hypothetical protein
VTGRAHTDDRGQRIAERNYALLAALAVDQELRAGHSVEQVTGLHLGDLSPPKPGLCG